jgi:hypothetical protein
MSAPGWHQVSTTAQVPDLQSCCACVQSVNGIDAVIIQCAHRHAVRVRRGNTRLYPSPCELFPPALRSASVSLSVTRPNRGPGTGARLVWFAPARFAFTIVGNLGMEVGRRSR